MGYAFCRTPVGEIGDDEPFFFFSSPFQHHAIEKQSNNVMSSHRIRFCSVILLMGFGLQNADSDVLVDFDREVLPLLSNNCFTCHGPDEANREAGLRLDLQEGAMAELDSGTAAVVPGDRAKSQLYKRLTTDDDDFRMPPVESGHALTPKQIEIIGKWIDQGAKWDQHWAFQTPRKPLVPIGQTERRLENPIDRFVNRRLKREDLSFSERANRATLIRRVSLDLIGLPPTAQQVSDFIADPSDDAYSKLVDRLLSSPRYGEHMGRHWLDAARYADTHGLHLDNERSIWPYREWVIGAFNSNMPFDQFTVEQLAGDLLPEPTLEQRVATGFNRCNVTTSEGGSIDDEYYVRYAVDRVETTSTVWLGLTAGCAACHDHKFDPLTQKEFYQLFSYFFSLTEKAMDGNALLPPPSVRVPSPGYVREKRVLEGRLSAANANLDKVLASIDYRDPNKGEQLASLHITEKVWFDDELPAGAKPTGPWRFVAKEEHPVFSGNNASFRSGEGLTQHFFEGAIATLEVNESDSLFTYVYLDPKDPPETIQLQFHDGSWEHRAYWGADKGHGKGKKGPANHRIGDLPKEGEWVRLEVPVSLVGLNTGSKLSGWAFTQYGGSVYWDKAGLKTVGTQNSQHLKSVRTWIKWRQEVRFPSLPKEIQAIVDAKDDKRSEAQIQQLTRYFLRNVHIDSKSLLQKPFADLDAVNKSIADLEKTVPASLIMEERKEPRIAHVLERGEYTKKREKVSSRVPDWLGPQLTEAPDNRLGLAQWLVDPSHPLTSRVTVNRIWQQLFGTGLVKTSEDFGLQGERPSHPELLDWLAIEFIETGWNLKRLLKLIVTSETYRQSAVVTPEKLAADPENRLLSRGPRFRLDAEIIRDSALFIGGLLVDPIGGKSVKPYQPAGLWKPVGFGGSNTSVFKQDSGSALYRRSMYTFWKRTSPPPSMITFDAPDRETCSVRRARTNTPLQSLVLMNDVQFLEAARCFAERIVIEGGNDLTTRAIFAFRTVTARLPSQSELESLMGLFSTYQKDFANQPEEAKKLIAIGESQPNKNIDKAELAAWTMVAHLLFNLDEAITKG